MKAANSTASPEQFFSPLDEFNRNLLDNVHPETWTRPEPAPRYNLVVLGGGTAGLVSAVGAASLGARVALVEKNALGGDCLNVGCVPSKALIRSARAAAATRTADRYGIFPPAVRAGDQFGERAVAGPEVHFDEVMQRVRRLRARLSPHDSARRLSSLGIDVFFGAGRFTGRDSLQVDGTELRFARAVIATGGRAWDPPIPGLKDVGYLTNENVFNLTKLPGRLAVIGAGPIGCELAQAFARLGSTVYLLEVEPRILPREDADAANIVTRALEADGVTLILCGKASSASRSEGGKVLHCEKDGQKSDLEVDEILVGVGRVPNVNGLDLERAEVTFDSKKGVSVDDRYRTSNPAIFAAGDICSRFKFTHAADAMARIVLANALFHGRGSGSALTIPWCTYTDPEVAHVGLYEEEARKQGLEVTTFTQELSSVDRAVLDGEEEGFARVHVKAGTDKILGATIVASHAGEMISELSLAMTAGIGLKTIARTIHPYPTQAEAIRKLADAYNRTRLTPWVKRLMTWWLTWQRRA